MDLNNPMGGTKDTPFNMAMLYYIQIQQIMIKITESLVTGDLSQAKEWIEELLTRVDHKLDTEEKKLIEEQQKNLKQKIQMYERTNDPQYHKQIKERLREMNRIILKLMAKYNMIFPAIEVKGLDRLYNRYDLKK